MKLESDVSVYTQGKVVVKNTVLFGNLIDRTIILLAGIRLEINFPPIELNNLRLGDVKEDLSHRFILVSSSPVEGSREIVSGSHWDNRYRRRSKLKLNLLQLRENPSNGSVASTYLTDDKLVGYWF